MHTINEVHELYRVLVNQPELFIIIFQFHHITGNSLYTYKNSLGAFHVTDPSTSDLKKTDTMLSPPPNQNCE